MTETLPLPALGTAPRCSPFSAELGIDPGGTAITAEQLILVATPGPWPKPIRDHPLLLGMMDVVGNAAVPSRMWAMHGEPDAVIRFRRTPEGVTTTLYTCPPDELPVLLAVIGDDAPDDRWVVSEEPTKPTVLVCTQGTHDVCCGSDGARFATQVAAEFPDVEVLSVSHTGGHRFAPTGMTFPDGRMWAWMDVDLVRSIVEGHGPAPAADRCRGWWGAGRGVEQIAERAVYAEVGRTLDGAQRRIRTDEEAGVVEVEAGDRLWTVRVTERRTVPTIACRADGGLPIKWATEHDAEIVADTHR